MVDARQRNQVNEFQLEIYKKLSQKLRQEVVKATDDLMMAKMRHLSELNALRKEAEVRETVLAEALSDTGMEVRWGHSSSLTARSGRGTCMCDSFNVVSVPDDWGGCAPAHLRLRCDGRRVSSDVVLSALRLFRCDCCCCFASSESQRDD